MTSPETKVIAFFPLVFSLEFFFGSLKTQYLNIIVFTFYSSINSFQSDHKR